MVAWWLVFWEYGRMRHAVLMGMVLEVDVRFIWRVLWMSVFYRKGFGVCLECDVSCSW